jgi:hypothetical protein
MGISPAPMRRTRTGRRACATDAFAAEDKGEKEKKEKKEKADSRRCAPRNDSENKRARKAPGPRSFFCCGVRLRAGRGRPGLQDRPLETLFEARMVSKNELCRGYPFPEWAL